ncbi:DUF5667 domain-containing protein [Pseudoneobacillus rhizosphaerae]|uniref:DUF5667 domain-containing protein n=1 Tax=Pseudoneobacillus rhizosphaerae TaxID=2880968 RepID=A0A9C7G7N8_9BACI|nr:DUF5667 domain-containing protein [Pseudoneobacillus rhizosphaerae]CAG9607088.1 hypothetical protein NEOCIP111885_00778 [Pseudoneobacillus rhizosphaerae]
MKKYINQIEMNKIAKTALAMVLAGSFTFSSSVALANDTTSEQSQSVEAPTETSVKNDTVTLTNDVTVQAKDETKVEAPKLVPGDFFYFAKLTLEKIRLMLTIDDVKEAALLATFASDRLAEAESLFKEGKEDLAVETIKKALEGMKVADSVVEEEKEKEKDTTTVEGEKVTTEDQTKTDGQVVTEPTADKTTDTVAVLEDEPTSDEKAVEEVKVILSQNIIALTAAMEKVKNPVAKAALQRNIEKSYAKLEKKLAKIEARLAKDTEETEVEEDTAVVITDQEKTTNTEVEVEVEKDNTVTETTEVTVTDEETEEATAVIPVVKKAKSEEKKAKAVVKQEEKGKKQEEKSKKQDAKSKMQEAKKVAKEKQQKENKETKGNAHKENKGKSQEKKNDNK